MITERENRTQVLAAGTGNIDVSIFQDVVFFGHRASWTSDEVSAGLQMTQERYYTVTAIPRPGGPMTRAVSDAAAEGDYLRQRISELRKGVARLEPEIDA